MVIRGKAVYEKMILPVHPRNMPDRVLGGVCPSPVVLGQNQEVRTNKSTITGAAILRQSLE
jgi:hypothetical protein